MCTAKVHVMSRLNHAAILPIDLVFEDSLTEKWFIQSPCFDLNLAQWIERLSSPVPSSSSASSSSSSAVSTVTKVTATVSDVINIVRCILNGVAYLHSEGIIHRDLKPTNIFVGSSAKQPMAVIGDFEHSLDPTLNSMVASRTSVYEPPILLDTCFDDR